MKSPPGTSSLGTLVASSSAVARNASSSVVFILHGRSKPVQHIVRVNNYTGDFSILVDAVGNHSLTISGSSALHGVGYYSSGTSAQETMVGACGIHVLSND